MELNIARSLFIYVSALKAMLRARAVWSLESNFALGGFSRRSIMWIYANLTLGFKFLTYIYNVRYVRRAFSASEFAAIRESWSDSDANVLWCTRIHTINSMQVWLQRLYDKHAHV